MHHESIHLVFSGGGTGGHLFPGLAVAEQFAAMIPNARITFVGSGKPFEQRHVARAGFEYLTLPSRPLPSAAREAVAFVVENLAGYLAAGRFLRDERAAAVVGLGGYASAPMAKAAIQHRVPLVLLEQNAVPGRATRWLARNATLVCAAFEETCQPLHCRCPLRVTGNPVRKGFHRGKSQGIQRRQIVILGGSGGAHSLNESVPLALYKVRERLRGWRVVHQSGEADVAATQTLYRKLALEAIVTPFLADMPGVLAATDLVVCRAGGTTLAELAVAGVPGVFLPYPHAADDHQLANANVFATAGAGVTIDQRVAPDQCDDRMAAALEPLLSDPALRGRMSSAMSNLARPTAAVDVADLIWSIVSSRSRQAQLAVA